MVSRGPPAAKGPPGAKDRPAEKKGRDFETTGFWLGKYEVTQAEWDGVMGAAANRSEFKGALLPVETVNWNECQAFIKNCAVPGMTVKLPHSDQWEYAFRGGSTSQRKYYWGNTLNGDKANCDGNQPYGATKGASKGKTTEVGTYEKEAPHPWGLCDMAGNVFEWCDDLHAAEGTDRVSVGGGWDSNAVFCWVGIRYRASPTDRRNNLGFRLALVP